MINFITVACRIFSRLKWCKNYINRLRLAKVIVKNKMSHFFMVHCVVAGHWEPGAPEFTAISTVHLYSTQWTAHTMGQINYSMWTSVLYIEANIQKHLQQDIQTLDNDAVFSTVSLHCSHNASEHVHQRFNRKTNSVLLTRRSRSEMTNSFVWRVRIRLILELQVVIRRAWTPSTTQQSTPAIQ